ncbi:MULTISPECIES: type II toxin-antitoxin system RelE/ParE family toxin [unclassified Mesorhizobium]|uniref:type II toxin-antitoxin system RelE/ParE family toxin n=1 Tax=unclassified Mesorhizobium TaxID=325217 RepID=UPI0024173DF1|nr:MULTISPECIES: type II toxin-antitoxin system RelE/ParE family toxin [unclassified Mesorhizobium]WFP62068.1 type II toxin-antitoxin system RelE/ParE family toxin [Mesorhizobium sp. WSM4904]WFP75339.1 type II toxin-antitoxin system RelE/ParE family toxin [Mesorhizobium sp. WSM4906]
MKRHVSWSREALEDLSQQIGFVARDNPAAARRLADRIREAGQNLGDMATGRPGRVTGTYEKPIGRLPYVIAYSLRPIAGRESVVILRVIHTSRDWPSEEWPI